MCRSQNMRWSLPHDIKAVSQYGNPWLLFILELILLCHFFRNIWHFIWKQSWSIIHCFWIRSKDWDLCFPYSYGVRKRLCSNHYATGDTGGQCSSFYVQYKVEESKRNTTQIWYSVFSMMWIMKQGRMVENVYFHIKEYW